MTVFPEGQEISQKAPNLASAAIYYHPDGFDTARPMLMGRQAAGAAFLKAYIRYTQPEAFVCYAHMQSHYKQFLAQIESYGADPAIPTQWIAPIEHSLLAKPGCLFIPGPNLTQPSWLRRHGDPQSFSLCGITHTTASEQVMDAIGAWLTTPVQDGDAVICTSQSARTMVMRMRDQYRQYLSQRLGADIPESPVLLPVIPLGVPCDELGPTPVTRQKGQDFRKKMGIGADDIVVLFAGRISFHAKAHPFPMYRALEEASRQTGKNIHLVLSGWFATDAIRQQFIDGAKLFCPSVGLHHVDGRQSDLRQWGWHAADIFTSLSDNIQETFGLTPLEAMAAGIPVVVTDWDGYRETVENRVHGFTIPTMMPAPGYGENVALRYALGSDDYDRYIGQTAISTVVDIEATTQAFVTLINDPVLRKTMGEAGQHHARTNFDWPIIIRQYQELWAHLADLRKHGTPAIKAPAGEPVSPLRDDPFHLFSHYATSMISDKTRVERIITDPTVIHAILALPMNGNVLAPAKAPDVIPYILDATARQSGLCASVLLEQSPNLPAGLFYQSLGRLAKLGILHLS